MYRSHRIAVVIPAFNEQRAIAEVVALVPSYVDAVVVVDDASSDATRARARAVSDPRVHVATHARNRGVGAAIVTGYRHALALGADAVAVMAGDGQMDPRDLPALLDPIADGRADYAKGNRFAHRDVWRTMPVTRLVGNVCLSLATRLTSGYGRVFDSQCGYTVIARPALERLDLARVFPRYGYPNDLLARLHSVGARVVDVPVRPVYGPAWRSGIRAHHAVYPVGFALARSWAGRLARRAWTRPIEARPIEARPIEARPIEARPIEARPIDARPIEVAARP